MRAADEPVSQNSRVRSGIAGGLIAAVLVAAAALFPCGTAKGQAPAADNGIHLGVAACAGNNCHGAVERLKGSSVPQNEYLIWSQKDKHRLAYAALLGERGIRIAKNLGLPDAQNAQICLDCHADNVPQDKRGREFQLTDGVGCEACHGAAVSWLGVHLSGAGHRANLAAGLYPTDQPAARAQKCLSCHFGDDKRFITHQIMGAGHPPMPFELDTYTAIEPAHFVVDQSYVERKGRPNDVQVWAIGQAGDLIHRMDALIDPKNAPKGVNPELVLFDCQSCHHAMNQLQWQPQRGSAGQPPGRLKLYDATAVMLRVIAARVAPDAAKALGDHMAALHQATGQDWAAAQREGQAVRQAASQLVPALAQHDFTRDDMKAMMTGVIDVGLSGDDTDYSAAQQAAMALQSIAAALKAYGYANDDQVKGMAGALGGLFEVVSNDQTYRPEAFVKALADLQKTVPQ
ncbi:MAG: hypothetical protein JO038_05030 [Alphaproteobacteria bacterium]|nr:hypothetical protein [Alphaproteobacteria bacterium]